MLVVSPFYWKVGEEGLFRHFATVAEAVDIPVVVYNLPMLTIDLSPSLVARIAAGCPNVVGLKDTVTEYLHRSRASGDQTLETPTSRFCRGGKTRSCRPSSPEPTAPSAFANVVPELFVNLVEAASDLTKAAELHRQVLTLVTLGSYSDPPIERQCCYEEARRSHLAYRPRTCSARPTRKA